MHPTKSKEEDPRLSHELSVMLPYVLMASRFAHYLKLILRNKHGSVTSAKALEQELQRWIQQYTNSVLMSRQELAAKYPLEFAQITIGDADRPGTYVVNLLLKPHFELQGVPVTLGLSFVARMREAGAPAVSREPETRKRPERPLDFEIVECERPGVIPVHLAAYCPKWVPVAVQSSSWVTLLAYLYLPEAAEAVRADSRNRLGAEQGAYGEGLGKASCVIQLGAEIVVVPELPGFHFNPRRASFLWLEDWHRIEFRMQADRSVFGFRAGTAVAGRISFYVGPLLVGQVEISTALIDRAEIAVSEANSWTSAQVYQAIFPSYSHHDTTMVEKLEKAYIALGMDYLRDVRILRSGQTWNPVLLKKIEEADIFQLCWSYNAKSSPAVEREWRHALKQQRQYFVRPVYWEKPLPEPPEELRSIHFAYLDW